MLIFATKGFDTSMFPSLYYPIDRGHSSIEQRVQIMHNTIHNTQVKGT